VKKYIIVLRINLSLLFDEKEIAGGFNIISKRFFGKKYINYNQLIKIA